MFFYLSFIKNLTYDLAIWICMELKEVKDYEHCSL